MPSDAATGMEMPFGFGRMTYLCELFLGRFALARIRVDGRPQQFNKPARIHFARDFVHGDRCVELGQLGNGVWKDRHNRRAGVYIVSIATQSSWRRTHTHTRARTVSKSRTQTLVHCGTRTPCARSASALARLNGAATLLLTQIRVCVCVCACG